MPDTDNNKADNDNLSPPIKGLIRIIAEIVVEDFYKEMRSKKEAAGTRLSEPPN